MDDRTRRIRGVLVLVLALNWAVAFLKMFVGSFINSSSMFADGIHSLSDGASNIIGIVAIYISSRPRDENHPYGHGKYETFSAMIISFLLIAACFQIVEGGISRFHDHQAANVSVFSFLVMILTMLVNARVVAYEEAKGRQLSSPLLMADALHTKSDIFTSLGVLLALAASKAGVAWVDPCIAIIISIFIGAAALRILKAGSKVLCDGVVLQPKEVEDVVMAIPGVKRCHKIRTRGREDEVYVDLHVQVSNNMRMDEAHKLSYKIEDSIKNSMPQVIDVVVHMEPLTSRDEAV